MAVAIAIDRYTCVVVFCNNINNQTNSAIDQNSTAIKIGTMFDEAL